MQVTIGINEGRFAGKCQRIIACSARSTPWPLRATAQWCHDSTRRATPGKKRAAQRAFALDRPLPGDIGSPAGQDFLQVSDRNIHRGRQIEIPCLNTVATIVAQRQYFGAHASPHESCNGSMQARRLTTRDLTGNAWVAAKSLRKFISKEAVEALERVLRIEQPLKARCTSKMLAVAGRETGIFGLGGEYFALAKPLFACRRAAARRQRIALAVERTGQLSADASSTVWAAPGMAGSSRSGLASRGAISFRQAAAISGGGRDRREPGHGRYLAESVQVSVEIKDLVVDY